MGHSADSRLGSLEECDQFFARRRAEGRNRKQKRKLSRRRRCKPGQLSSKDRRHGSRRSRPQGKTLCNPDSERFAKRDVPQILR